MTRILIVEDSLTQARQLTLILEDAGYEVEAAGDAADGFARLGQRPFDLVVSDLMLPGDSGFDLCRRVKASPRHRNIPVVVLTGQSDPANVLRGLQAGADGFMTKDLEPDEILGRLRRVLAHGGRPAGPAEPARVTFLGEQFELTSNRDQLLSLLLAAFEETLRDRDFLDEAKKETLDIDPVKGSEVDALLADAYATPKAVAEKAARATTAAE